MNSERLAYICKATKQRHNAKGFVYRSVWDTGYENLVFSSHEEAQRFAASRKMQFCPAPSNSCHPVTIVSGPAAP